MEERSKLQKTTDADFDLEAEPRWPAVIALLAVGGLSLALPSTLSVGPRWLLFVVVGILLVPTVLTHRVGHHKLNFFFGQLLAGVATLFMIISIGNLIRLLPKHTEPPITLLTSAAVLWVTNVLIFASWYWRLDAGGPHKRDMRRGHPTGAFLFPQMTLDTSDKDEEEGDNWAPQFMDYLFLAFNFSTALSPADTSVLSRWAKSLVMVQASISLTIIVILAARAVNIL